MKGVKVEKSGRQTYGGKAVGYVQVKRLQNICTVKGRITPEHNVKKKAYPVEAVIDETDRKILNVNCEGCVAQLGGCKHGVAFISWLHRRSEEPSSTSVTCYWKKSTLSSVGTTLKFVTCKDFGDSDDSTDTDVSDDEADDFLQAVVEEGIKNGRTDCQLIRYYVEPTEIEKASLHYMMIQFHKIRHNHNSTAAEFKQIRQIS